MWCADEDDRSILGHLPATPRVHFAEEKFDQDGKCPQEGIVDVFVHGRDGLLASCLGRHAGGAAFQAQSLKTPRNKYAATKVRE